MSQLLVSEGYEMYSEQQMSQLLVSEGIHRCTRNDKYSSYLSLNVIDCNAYGQVLGNNTCHIYLSFKDLDYRV